MGRPNLFLGVLGLIGLYLAVSRASFLYRGSGVMLFQYAQKLGLAGVALWFIRMYLQLTYPSGYWFISGLSLFVESLILLLFYTSIFAASAQLEKGGTHPCLRIACIFAVAETFSAAVSMTDLFLDSVGAGWDWILIGRVLVQWALAFWIMVRFADLRRDYMPEETMEDIQ